MLVGLSARWTVKQVKMCRCPGGSVRAGGTCVNVNECLENPCLNGGTCVDREPARRYDCVCAFGYTGHDCELELLASGIITPSRDFIIAIIVCLFLLLGEHFHSLSACLAIIQNIVNILRSSAVYSYIICYLRPKLPN